MVLVDFEGNEADELTVHVGDLVKNVSKAAEDGWLQGELRGVRGIFPANFVKEVPAYLKGGENREPRSIRKPKTVKGPPTRRCEVLFAYNPMNEDELELTVGETVEILKEIEDGWWLGKSNYKLGVFPSNFVKEIFVTGKDYKPAEGKSRPKLTDAIFTKEVKEQQRTSVRRKINSVNECCQVMFDYKSVLDDELDLKKGDIVTIISKDSEDEGWWEGELNGRRGYFPDNFVMVLTVPHLPGAMSQPPARQSPEKPPGETEPPPVEKAPHQDGTDLVPPGQGREDKTTGSMKQRKAPPPPVKDKPSWPPQIKTNGEQSPSSPKPAEEKKEKDVDQFDNVNVSPAKLNHPTANRAKPPHRRPPTNLHSPSSPTGDPEQAEFDMAPKKLPGLAKETCPVVVPKPTSKASQEEAGTMDDVRTAVRDLQMALALFKAQHERDMEDLKAELKDERSKRVALQEEVQALKKTVKQH
ncbi:SH3 domain-containing protein 21 isoform X2 [Brienomyrus brachyistius]|nr:SH3 domain-containing protein 21 isoform X2 [Brienomyrus brachyistius]